MKYLGKDPIPSKPSTEDYRKGWEATFARRARGKSRAPTMVLGDGPRVVVESNGKGEFRGARLTSPAVYDEWFPRLHAGAAMRPERKAKKRP